MNNLLFGIALSALLSTTSLLIVLFRVSPLTSPTQALPAFFGSLFLSVSTVAAFALIGIWRVLPLHSWDTGKVMSIALRQGIFIGIAVCTILLFHIWNLLTWWVGLLIAGVFLLIELALDQ